MLLVVILCCNIGPSKSLQKASAALQLQSPAKTDGNVGEFVVVFTSDTCHESLKLGK